MMKKLRVIVGVALCMVFVVLCVISLIRKNRIPPADEVLVQYMKYIETGDFENMYHILAKESKAEISKKQFIKRNENIYRGIEAKNIKITINQKESREDRIQYHVKMDSVVGKIAYNNTADFVKENGVYALKWKDQIIFPWLTQQDKVVVATLKAKRGEIYDRNGIILAGEGTVSSVGVVPGKQSKDEEQRMKHLKQLAELLETTPESIEKKLEAEWIQEDSFVPIKKLMKNDASNDLREKLLILPGVMVADEVDRVYPLAEKASHLVGYVQKISGDELEKLREKGYDEQSIIGKSGLESLYEARLHGRDGCKIAIVDQDGKEKIALGMKAEEHGENIVTTIDSNLQDQIYKQYQEDKSCTVAMNPMTGEVLALVNTPSFDSNDFILGFTRDQWDSLNEEESKPLLNRFRQSYSPGSAIKPVIGAMGLDMGIITPEENFGESEGVWQKDQSWGDYEITTGKIYDGAVNLQNALIHSDNIYFAKVAIRMGGDGFVSGLSKFGFHKELPFAIQMKKSQYGNGGNMESEIKLADSGYGQGEVLVNPLHLAAMYTTFLHEGDMIEPYLEYRENKKGNVWVKGVISKESAEVIGEHLVGVVESGQGDAHGLFQDTVAVGGMTGVVERKGEDGGTEELGWLVSYTSDMQRVDSILVISMVEDVKESGGSAYVVEKGKEVLDGYLKKG